MTAKQIVDGILDEGWLSAGWEGIKRLTGLGHDSFGLGKNTEKGWKPKYGARDSAKRPIRREPPKENTTWDIG